MFASLKENVQKEFIKKIKLINNKFFYKKILILLINNNIKWSFCEKEWKIYFDLDDFKENDIININVIIDKYSAKKSNKNDFLFDIKCNM